MSSDDRKVCFVVMGFGKKTDYETGRTLDLDATYEAIIQPAVEGNGMRCVRADEIMHSGVIDARMYEMLLRADLVVADISTGNVNAVYELGVRHGLRPNSTIIMKEAGGRLHFDLDHVSTFRYQHLGEDIGVREATRARRALSEMVTKVMSSDQPDSPVYTFLPRLQQPQLTEAQFAQAVDEAEATQEKLAGYMRAGEQAMRASRHEEARNAFAAAAAMKPGEPYVLQQLALATYKSEEPSPLEALIQALKIMEPLSPEQSNDPETLGICGAIRKRLWLLTKDSVQLEAAIRLYGRGFEVRRDYYNGENLAVCHDYRASTQLDPAEVTYAKMTARKIRQALVEILTEVVQAPTFQERSDRKWVFATLANCHFALGLREKAMEFEVQFLKEQPADWEVRTYEEGKSAVATGALRPA